MSSSLPQIRAPLLWLLLPYMIGLTAAWIWPLSSFGLGLLTFAATVSAGVAFWTINRHPGVWAPALLISVGLSGWALLQLRYPQLHERETRPPREITLTLEIDQLFPSGPTARSLSGLGKIVATDESNQTLIGRRVYFSAIRRISVPTLRSGRYLIRGVLEPLPQPIEEIGFTRYLTNLGIRQQITRAQLVRQVAPPGRWASFCTRTEKRLEAIISRGLDAHPGIRSIYLAMLLGEKAVLSTEQENAFLQSGTFHVFSISGLHVGVIAVALHSLGLILRTPRRPTMVITVAMLWLYVQITGASTPALRALLMIACLLTAKTFRLPGNALAALAASALITLLLDPLQLFSTGFQMSYSVVGALILMGAPLGERWLERWQPFRLRPRPAWRWWHRFINWSGRKVIAAVAGCWTAFLASAAAGIGFFGLFSPGSFPANLLILPLASLAIIAGFLSLLTGLVGLWPCSVLCNSAAGLLIIGIDWLLRQGTALPGMYFPARFRAEWLTPAAMALMTVLMLAGASSRWSRRLGGYWPPVIVLGLLVIFGVKFD
jgi:competence protein ComEC